MDYKIPEWMNSMTISSQKEKKKLTVDKINKMGAKLDDLNRASKAYWSIVSRSFN